MQMDNFYNLLSERLASAQSRQAPDSRAKVSHCRCGQTIFFGNTHCVACSAQLGFEPDRGELLALDSVPADGNSALSAHAPAAPDGEPPSGQAILGMPISAEGHWRLADQPDGPAYRRCRNLDSAAVCNWLVPADDPSEFCLACRLNRTIPNLSQPDNPARWHKLEAAKRRLVAQLLTLGLPVQAASPADPHALAFDLVGPDADGKPPLTGHDEGLITINVLEADDDYRARLREEMHEPYRTLLGHFRHEVGHYYWDKLVRDTSWLDQFREVFGDERADYAASLAKNYNDGPPPGWALEYISTYAACHPWEDWAETWAHYLHMMDTVDTALSFGLTTHGIAPDYVSFNRNVLVDPEAPDAQEFLDLVNTWVALTGVLNELSRSMGQRDFYPFVLPHKVVGKLQFVHQVVKAKSLGLKDAP